MGKVKCFSDFVNETYLENPADADVLKHNKKKMKKNGYVEVSVTEPFDGLETGDKVLVSATEFGQLEKDSLVTCYKDEDEFIVPKKNLQINA